MKKQLEAIKDTMRKAQRIGSCFIEPDERRLRTDPLKYQAYLDSRAGHGLGCFIAEKIAKQQCILQRDFTSIIDTNCTEYRYEAVVIHPDDWNELTKQIIDLEGGLKFTAKIEKQIKDNQDIAQSG